MKKLTLLFLALSLSFSFFAQENELLTKKAFWIQSAMNVGKNGGGCWDLAGGPKVAQKGMNIAIWNIDNGNDRLFKLVPSRKFKGFYEIHSVLSGYKAIDISGGKQVKGSNIQLWDNNSSSAQAFKFKHIGNGKFKILSTQNKVICLKGGKNANGTNVHLWDDHNAPQVFWYLIDPNTKKAVNPDKIPTTPVFFKKAKNYKLTLSYIDGSIQTTAKLIELTNNQVKLSVKYPNNNIKEEVLSYPGDGFYYLKSRKAVSQVNEYYKPKRLNMNFSGADEAWTIIPIAEETFFTNNKTKTFKYSSSNMVASTKGTAKVIKIKDNITAISVTATGISPRTGKKETKSFELKIEFIDGKYHIGRGSDYPQVGKIDETGKRLNIGGDQNTLTFELP